MSKQSPADPTPDSKEVRLAAQLRANLRRRKAHSQKKPEAAALQAPDLPKDGEAR
jgi:hypothetical protein